MSSARKATVSFALDAEAYDFTVTAIELRLFFRAWAVGFLLCLLLIG